MNGVEAREKNRTETRSRSQENLKFGHLTLLGRLGSDDTNGYQNATKQLDALENPVGCWGVVDSWKTTSNSCE